MPHILPLPRDNAWEHAACRMRIEEGKSDGCASCIECWVLRILVTTIEEGAVLPLNGRLRKEEERMGRCDRPMLLNSKNSYCQERKARLTMPRMTSLHLQLWGRSDRHSGARFKLFFNPTSNFLCQLFDLILSISTLQLQQSATPSSQPPSAYHSHSIIDAGVFTQYCIFAPFPPFLPYLLFPPLLHLLISACSLSLHPHPWHIDALGLLSTSSFASTASALYLPSRLREAQSRPSRDKITIKSFQDLQLQTQGLASFRDPKTFDPKTQAQESRRRLTSQNG